MAMEEMEPQVAVTDADAAARRRALQRLCGTYEELADEACELSRPVDERAGLALFKIDEAGAAAARLLADTEPARAQLLGALAANARELEDVFLRVALAEVRGCEARLARVSAVERAR